MNPVERLILEIKKEARLRGMECSRWRIPNKRTGGFWKTIWALHRGPRPANVRNASGPSATIIGVEGTTTNSTAYRELLKLHVKVMAIPLPLF